MQGTIQRWGNSQGVRIPKSILSMAHMQENDSVEIVPDKGCILIRKVNRYRNLDELFAGYHSEESIPEWNLGKDVGAEVWEG